MDPRTFPKAPSHLVFPKAPSRDLDFVPEKMGPSRSLNPCKDCQQFSATLQNLKSIIKNHYGTNNMSELKKSLKIYHEALQYIVQHCIKCADDTSKMLEGTAKLGIFADPQGREQLQRERQNHMRIALRAREVIEKIDKCTSNMNYERCYRALLDA
jgi:hypothetical protein